MHRILFFDPGYYSWRVRDESAVLVSVAGCSSGKGLVLQPNQARRGVCSRFSARDWQIILDERSPAVAHLKPQASPVRVDLNMNPPRFDSHGWEVLHWHQPLVRLCCLARVQPVK
jgi:hypothetical protein